MCSHAEMGSLGIHVLFDKLNDLGLIIMIIIITIINKNPVIAL